MKLSKKLLALLLCLTVVLSLVPMVSAEEVLPLANEDEVVIYYTNDVHTYIDKTLSYDNIADLKTQTALQAAGVLLVDAGDHVQGTAYGSMDKGATIVELMEAAGYDLATLGNHEFDYGMTRALEIATQGNVPYVSCNFYHEESGVPGDTVLDAYRVFEVGGLRIAFIGVTTPESFTKSTPAYFQDEDGNYIYGIAGGEDGSDLYQTVQAAIDAASQEADLVIALAHLGDDTASRPWTSEELIANTTGLDALVDGHSHSTVPMKEVEDAEGNTVVLTQTGEYFNAIGKMTIHLETQEVKTELLTEYEGSNEDVKAIKDAWMGEIDEQLGEVIGYAEVTLDNYDAEGTRLVRKVETNTGDFAADALYYLFDNMGLDVDVAIMNGGGVRNKAITGELSYKTMKDIHTFGNVACLQTITGQQLLDALEWGARGTYDEEVGGFLHVSGITYEIHTYIDTTVQMDDKGVWVGGPTGEYRVKNVKILQDGEYVDLDLEGEYNLAGYNYTLRDLGDGFAMFDGAVNVLDYVMEDYMVLANYVESFPVSQDHDGLPTITADNSPYASVTGEGRITLVTEKEEEEHTHVFPEAWIVVKDPSSTEDGLAERYCECGEKETMSIDKLENRFEDVNEKEYYFEPVLWGDFWGITAGATETTFEPEENCTRAQIVTFLWRACGEPEHHVTENPFQDLDEEEYYVDAVLWAYENGITAGVSKTRFAPDLPCTRAEAVSFLHRAVGEEQTAGKHPFTDLKEGEYYVDAVTWAYENEVVAGVTETTFAPDLNCTRAQIISFLYRLLHV